MNTEEIAKKLNISRATVSRVINNHPNVKESTRQAVLSALKKYGYTPNESARSLVKNIHYKIAFIVFSDPAFFWNQVESGVNAARNDLPNVTIDYFRTDIQHPEEQLNLLKSLPERGYQAIAIAPNSPALLVDAVDDLASQNFPVVVVNVEIPSAKQLCYIGCNYTQSGILAAEILAKSINHQGKVVILDLQDPVIPIAQRVIGFRTKLSDYSSITIGHILHFPRSGENVYESVLKLLQTDPDISGIFVSFAALEETAKAVRNATTSNIAVIGYDLNHDIYSCLKDGSITATICHEPFNQGYYAVKTLYRYLNLNIVPKQSIVYSKLEVVFSSNAKYYLNTSENLELFYLYHS